MDIKRNFGLALYPEQATLLVYFDAGHEGEMFLFHLQYETNVPGKYHTEFLFSSHCLVPMGRNVPHSELDSAYRASKQADIILEWLQKFIVRKALIGDAQVCLFWILNRVKRTNTFIRNRTHAISRTFTDSEIFYIPTAHNPADMATKFRAGFEDSYKQLGDGQPFRVGPGFMSKGLQAAIDDGDITNITNMSLTLEAKRAARNQLLDPGADGAQATDTMTPAEMIFLAATAEIPTNQEVNYNSDPILLCTEKEQQIETPVLIPTDGSLSKKIAERSHHSNYIVSPIRKAYNKMYDATTIALMAAHYLLTGSGTNSSRLKLANRLHPSACTKQTNQFVLGRDDSNGALHQKFKHSQLLHLEQQAEQARILYHQDQKAIQQWEVLTKQGEERLNQMQTGEPNYELDGWSKEVDRSITNLMAFINLFKYKQKSHKQTQCNNLSKSTIQELFSSSFSPANDERIKTWISYPGMSTAVRRSREIDSLVTDISKQPVQDLSDVLNPGSALYEAIQELVNLSQQAFNSAMAIASSQAGPIVVSILAPTVKKADKVISGIKGSTYRPRSSADWDRLWERTSFLLSSEQQTWPDRKFHRLGELFETVEDYQNWSLLTSNYLMQKASSECERFFPKQKLNKIGIKDSDGIWKARHRLYHVTWSMLIMQTPA